PPPAPVIGPVLGQERIEALDILRGVAILGILIVNMGLFSSPEDPSTHQLGVSAVDRIVAWLILFLAQEKFKALFSFLFGLGLAVQLLRAEARVARFVPLYARRLGVLFLIGVAHFLLVWDGDILHDYAQNGFLLLLFRRRSLKTLLVAAGVLLSLPVLLYGLTTYNSITGHVPPQARQWIAYETGVDDQETEAADRVYARGTYAEMVTVRARELPRDVSPDTDDAYVLALFLLGLYAGRRRIFHNIAAHRPFIRRVQRWGLLIGIAGNAAFAVGGSFDPAPTSVVQNVGRMCLVLAAPALMLFYASTIMLLTQVETWRRRLAPLAAVGRTALSNYLLQSLICTMIFFSYGLGLFGKVGPALGLLLTVTIFLIQVPLSVWWLERYQFGPVEWLWRSLTYWRPQPMRVNRRL
ncbi:MAG TPA: DUF418 domain-containing protein, partial [Gemmatimonadales bacterium]|nr:DUF418 domain-containing protein [Gemmatimonadales bacterium]